MNIRNVQMAMRTYQEQHGYAPGSPGFEKSMIFETTYGDPYLTAEPKCPSGGTYTWLEGQFPPEGEVILRCSHPDHEPPWTDGW